MNDLTPSWEVGSRMDAILPVHVLPQDLQESDRELRQRHPKTVNWSGIGTVCDVWS